MQEAQYTNKKNTQEILYVLHCLCDLYKLMTVD